MNYKKFLYALLLLIPFSLGFISGSWYEVRNIDDRFDTKIRPHLDTIYNQGFEYGKISMCIGMIRVIDSIGIKRPVPWDLKRANQIADSIKNAK